MVTAVLLKWKRITEIESIKREIEKVKEIDEIIIWDNTIINMMAFGRYLAALQAKNNIIYTQDDDCFVNNIKELINNYDGENIINNLNITHLEYQSKTNHTLVGWGSIFDKSWINVFNEYIDCYGIDNLLLREADRIFTGFYGKYKSIEGKIDNIYSAYSDFALYKQTEHESFKNKAIDIINDRRKR